MSRLCFHGLMFALFTWVAAELAFAQAVGPEAEAVATIERLGGRVYRDSNNLIDIVSLENSQATDADLVILRSLPNLRVLDLDGTQVTDVGLEHLLPIPSLQEVSLRRTKVTEQAALHFKDQHTGVYYVEMSPGFQPKKLLMSGILLFPMLLGVWLFRAAQRKKEILSPRIYARGIGLGMLLVVASVLMMIVAIVQAFGVEFTISDLFG